MHKVFLLVSIGWFLFSCNQSDQKNSNSFLNPSTLTSETFTIDITKDTVLLSKKGAVIKIPKGSLASTKGSSAEIVIKEAYSVEDMLRAGLTTTSKGTPLSSGGMIYLNTSSPETDKITGPISIAIPTSSIDKEMKLFKGTESNDQIDWIEPIDIPTSPQTSILDKGEALFKTNCASCHGIGKDMTGPDLAHIVKRSKKIAAKEGHNFLYDYTLNFNRVAGSSRYYTLVNCSRASVMTIFEGVLTKKDLDQLYSYIENESNVKNLPVPHFEDCVDSCFIYKRVVDSLDNRLQDLAIPVPMVIEKYDDGLNPNIKFTNGQTIVDTLVSPLEHQSYFYQFTVTQAGWYNVDKLLNVGYPENVLICSPKQSEYKRINYYLVIPSLKAVIPGGPIKQEGRTGFFSINGTIPLPTGIKAYIIALGEYDDNIIFSKMEFFVQRRQDFELDMKMISKEEFNKEIASLNFEDVKFEVADTKNANELRSTIKNRKDAEKLKPVGCKCDCFLYPFPQKKMLFLSNNHQ